jgi:uncharacterized membrane protein
MALLKQWGAGLVVFVLLDAVWLGVVASGFYKDQLGPLLRVQANGNLDPRIAPVVLLYALIVLGLALFALPRAHTSATAAMWSALFGVIAYSVYDLTNYSTMRGFPLEVVVIDMLWGGVLCAVTGTAMHLVGRGARSAPG